MLVVGVALAPLALASIIQAILNFRAYQKETDRILMQTALYAAYSEQNIFTRAEQVLRSIARRADKLKDPQECHAELLDALVGAMPIVNLTLADSSGAIICMGARPPPLPTDVRLRWWSDLRKADRVIVGNQFHSPLLKRALLPMALPLHDKNGAFVGAVSAAVDLEWLESAPQVTKLPEGALSLIIDRNGRVLAANRTAPSGLPQAVATHVSSGQQKIFTVNTSAGQRWRWVSEPIGISEKYVAFGIPEPRLLGTFRGYLLADVVLTLLIVAATVFGIWLGTEWLVIRWTHYLKRVAVAYGRNHFSLSLADLKTAPNEFRLLGREMKRMASAIQDRDRNLSMALERQSGMVREIHHRVKNNLQIVSSLIHIYAENISHPIAKAAFRQVISRVDALTLIQRLIEKSESDPTLDMRLLFSQLGEQLRSLAIESGQVLDLRIEVSHPWLSPDIATPVVLFAVEAISFDFFQAHPETRHREVQLRFSSDQSSYLLEIDERLQGTLPSAGTLAGRILKSISDQLRGQYDIKPLNEGGTRLHLRLPLNVTVEPDSAAPAPRSNIYPLDAPRSRQA